MSAVEFRLAISRFLVFARVKTRPVFALGEHEKPRNFPSRSGCRGPKKAVGFAPKNVFSGILGSKFKFPIRSRCVPRTWNFGSLGVFVGQVAGLPRRTASCQLAVESPKLPASVALPNWKRTTRAETARDRTSPAVGYCAYFYVFINNYLSVVRHLFP